jgi:hypothetical protein
MLIVNLNVLDAVSFIGEWTPEKPTDLVHKSLAKLLSDKIL